MSVLREATPTARKQHRCELCSKPIERGERHHNQVNIYDGAVYNYRQHVHCNKIFASAFAELVGACDPGDGLHAGDVHLWMGEQTEAKIFEVSGRVGVAVFRQIVGEKG